MKKILIILLVISIQCQAKTFYISAFGNNTTGLSDPSAWTSIKKLNTMWGSINAGDSILFHCGETFNGSIQPTTSGYSLDSNIVFGSYGVGAKPKISGLYVVDGWTANGTNKWICTPDSITKANCNVFTIDAIPKPAARTNWMKYYSCVASSSSLATLHTVYLNGTPSYVGGEVVIRTNTYIIQKATITAQSGGTITYANNTQPIYNNSLQALQSGTDSMGFFIQRNINAMDSQDEWYFNKSTNKMNLYSTTNPSTKTIKASYIDTLFVLASRGHIKITGLEFEGAGVYAIESYGGTDVIIENCDFSNNTKAIYVWNTSDIRIANNVAINNFNGGIFVRDRQARRVTIDSNVVNYNGQLIGMGVYNNENSLRGIVSLIDSTRSNNYNRVIGNTVKNTGNAPIYVTGSNTTVRRNVIDTFANQVDDMGGIYTFKQNQDLNLELDVNVIIDSNFISNAIGAPLGTRNGDIDVVGLYLDDQAVGISAYHNTIYNIPGTGLQLNTPRDMVIKYNTIYNCVNLINENQKLWGLISNIKITNNIIYQKILSGTTSTQRIFYHINERLNGSRYGTGPAPTFTPLYYPAKTLTQSMIDLGTIDSNWISNLQTNSYQSITRPESGVTYTTTNSNLSTWKSPYTHDIVSVLPPLTITSSNTRLYANPKNTDSIINFFGNKKQDPKGNIYNHTATIPKWSSLILIDNGTAPNSAPSSNAGVDKIITLPTNSTSVTATSVDPEGMAISSLWTKTSGPSTYTIVNSTSLTTSITNLVQGVYQFTYTATDPLGASSSDVMQITVNPIPNTAPSVNAGVDKEINLPTNSVSVTGTATDAEGGTLLYVWTRVGGTGTTYNVVSPTSLTTTINNLSVGTHDFELSVTDNGGLVGRDQMHILVNPTPLPPNQYPVADAGSNITVTLPINYTTLNSSASYDPDGTISSRIWSKMAGSPAGGDLSSTTAISPNVTNLVEGIYYFQVVVKDNNDSTDNSIVTVTVNAAAENLPPSVNAGVDQNIRFPVSVVTVVADTLDTDGHISTIVWSKISGPIGDSIGNPTVKQTTITFSESGIYNYAVIVIDNGGLSSIDYITITVSPEYTAPTVSTGGDIIIQLPLNSALLTASAVDLDGAISSSLWEKISGPLGDTIVTPTLLSTDVTGLVQGLYKYKITATDNDGLSSSNIITVTVIPYQNPPKKTSVTGYKISKPNPEP